MEIEIREIQVEDAPDIAALSAAEFGYRGTDDETALLIRDISSKGHYKMFAALSDGKVIGWIQCMETYRLEAGVYSEITGLVVKKEYRREGAGGKLIEYVRHLYKDDKVPKLTVRCNTKRRGAHKFYLGQHFKVEKHQKIFSMPL